MMDIFKNIPNKYRHIPFWSWNEMLEIGETARQCRVMKNVGIGGYPRSFAKTPRIWESDTSALPWNDGYCLVTMSVK